jgi:hypothetical protein
LARRRPIAKVSGGSTRLRLLITLFALFAFSLQTYIGQIHIHFEHDATASSQKHAPDKFPANGDPANCPICQEVLHNGQFVTPSAAALLPPTFTVSVVSIVTTVPIVARAISHGWRSRAPPKA